MLWSCPQCHYADNRGLARHCVHCGKAKTEHAIERMPDDTSINNALSGNDLRKAKAGPDWKCKFCATLQNSLEPFCQECGSPKDDSKKTSKAPAPKKVQPQRMEHYPNPLIHENIPAPTHEFLPNTGNYRDPPVKVEPPTPPAPQEPEDVPEFRKTSPAVKKALLGAAIVASVVFALWLLLRTKEYDVTVQNVSWRHTVKVQRFHSVNHEGFDPPGNAENTQDLGMRFHHMNHLLVGSHPETQSYTYSCRDHCITTRGICTTTPERCTTTPRNCTSNKNGTASCTGGDRSCTPASRSCAPDTERCSPCTGTRVVMIDDYRDFPVSRSYYSWSEWEWTYARTVPASGSSTETHWPSDKELEPGYALQPREQERFVKESYYEVIFSNNKETWKIHPETLDEFSRYPLGKHYKIRANAAGSVTVLSGQGNGSSADY